MKLPVFSAAIITLASTFSAGCAQTGPAPAYEVAEAQRRFDALAESFPALNNNNQYVISVALLNADLLDFKPDISTLIAYTGLGNSSIYKALNRMMKENLIEIYTIPGDQKRKYVRATNKLIDQHVKYLEVAKSHISVFASKHL